MSTDSRRDWRRGKHRNLNRTPTESDPLAPPAPIKIENDVPLPERPFPYDRVRDACEVLAKAEIGDSTYIEDVSIGIVSAKANRAAGSGWYTARTDGDGVRIWKMAEPTGYAPRRRGRVGGRDEET